MSGPRYHAHTHHPLGTDPLPGVFKWARRRALGASDQTVPTTSERNVALNDFVTDSTDTFETYDTGTVDAIKVLRDGLYSILARIFWSDWPGDHELAINGVDPDAYADYAFSAGAISNTLTHTASMDARLQANQYIHMTVYHEFGSDRDIDGAAGTYLEIRRLGEIDVTETESGS